MVDIDALREAVESGQVAAQALMCFPTNPNRAAERFKLPLQGLPNVILTPHVGGSTLEAQENIGRDAAMKLVQYMDRGATVGSHSVPPLSLPTHQNANRILHIHRNVPGILSAINTVLSQHNLNIVGQYLSTNSEIGYVVLDVEKSDGDVYLPDLKRIAHTIKVRMLY